VADEIAYNTADLDDGYEAHLLSLKEIREGVPIFEKFYREVEATYPDAIEKLKFNEALKKMLNRLVGDLIRNTETQIKQAGIKALEDVRAYPDRLVTLSDVVEKERAQAKEFLYSTMYNSATLAPEKIAAERVIRELFEFWMVKPENLPSSYREKSKQDPLPRVVCDYIAGMTDNYIYEQYEKYCAK
jgi:dGTPase